MKKLALGFALLVAAFGFAGARVHAQGIPLPTISVSPSSYDFGNVPVGAVANTTLTVTNTGGGTLNVTAVKTKAPFGDNATSFSLGAGQSQQVIVTFAPSAPVQYNSVCTFQSNANNAPVLHVPLAGMGN